MRTPRRKRRPTPRTAVATLALLTTSTYMLTPSPAGARTAYDWTPVSSTVETEPVASAGDAADDPAIWVDKQKPRQSLVIGNDKNGALESYGLDGKLVQRLKPSSFVGNVDVRGDMVAAASNGVRLYTIDPYTRLMSNANQGGRPISTSGEGLCLYDPGAAGVSGGLYVFTVTRQDGRVREYQIKDPNGDETYTGDLVRDFTIGTESEGCVADDAAHAFFVSEEDTAVWLAGGVVHRGGDALLALRQVRCRPR